MATEIINAGPVPDAGAVAARAAQTEIKVGGTSPTPISTPTPKSTTTENKVPIAAPIETPKPNPGFTKLQEKLRAKATPVEGAPVEKPKTDTPDPNALPVDPSKAAAVDPNAPPNGDKKTKANPWKLLDERKKEVSDLQTKLAEVEKRAIPEAKFKEMESQLAEQKKRNDELESHMRLMDYSKSSEFQDKYQKPYEAAWGRAMDNLRGLTVQDQDGNEREVNAQDLLALVNEPNLRLARAKAREIFGDEFANDVMNHRNEIRKLYDEQAAAIEDARKNAGQHAETNKKAQAELSQAIANEWTSVNKAAAADPTYGKYFSPKDGDQVGNQKLAKGYELVDRAFSENPQAPGLTMEQRKDIINRHAVVRNRAAAFGRMRHWLTEAETKVAALEKELKQYRGSEPTIEGRSGAEPSAPEAKGINRLYEVIRKKAKPI